MKEELKPCPFCGKNKIRISYHESDAFVEIVGWWYAECRYCKASLDRKTKNGAIKAWNRRPK